MRALGEQRVAEVGAEEAGAAGDDDVACLAVLQKLTCASAARPSRQRRRRRTPPPRDGAAEMGFEFAGAVRRGVLGEHARRAPRPPRRAALLRPVAAAASTSSGVSREGDLRAGREERVQPVPRIGHDRRAAGRGLEQPHAGAVPGADHVGAGDVQGEAARGVEGRMVGRRHVLQPLDVGGPVDLVGVLRPGHHEAPLRRAAGGLEQQPLQRRLAVGAVGAEIAQVPARRRVGQRPVGRRVHGAVQRARRRRAVAPLQQVERRPAGEGEIEVEAGDQRRREVLVVAARELGERHRRVDVVEGGGAARRFAARDARPRRPPARRSRRSPRRPRRSRRDAPREAVEVRVEREAAEVRVGQVAVRRVPGHVALQEQHLVAARREGLAAARARSWRGRCPRRRTG